MYHTEIHVKGKINPDWSDWFGELQMQETSCDKTILTGKLPDMAAVYGVISRLGSLVIPLVSVSCVEEADPDGCILHGPQAQAHFTNPEPRTSNNGAS